MYQDPRSKLHPLVIPGAIVGAILALILSVGWIVASENPHTPAGYVGYVTRGAVMGQAEFVKTQQGPTSAGRGWLLDVTNVSVTPYTLTESFAGDTAVLAADNLRLQFQVHSVFRVKPDRVREFIEKYSALADHEAGKDDVMIAYNNFIREPLRTAARDEIQKLDALDVKTNIDEITAKLTAWTAEYTKDSPFEIMSVVVGNIQYPDQVANAVADKLSATQTLEKKTTEIKIARAEAERLRIEAEGKAKAAGAQLANLTPLYVQNRAVDAMERLSEKQNTTVIYIPVGANGVPVVRTQ